MAVGDRILIGPPYGLKNAEEYVSGIEGAISDLGSTPTVLQFSTDQTLTGNLIIPDTIRLAPMGYAKIIHGAYTINPPAYGAIDSTLWPLAKIFEGTGLVNLGGRGGMYACPEWWGAKGTGQVDDTTAIQAAFNSGRSVILFQNTTYKVTPPTADAEACLELNLSANLQGSGGRMAQIRADVPSENVTTSILKVDITYNRGYVDCRHWTMRDLGLFYGLTGGKHGIILDSTLALISCTIDNCTFSEQTDNGGYSIYVPNDEWAQSKITNTGFISAYMQCGDANTIEKCVSFGEGISITFDLNEGVRNNIVRDNTLVSRDGAVKIINGDNIRIINNQIELGMGYTPAENQSVGNAMVWIEGVDRPVQNTIIRQNNFGGGLNVGYLINIDNGRRTVIGDNNLVPALTAEIIMSENSRYNIIEPTNVVPNFSRRYKKIFKAKVVDNGLGNMGVEKAESTLDLQNGWTGPVSYYKNTEGVIRFIGTVSSGVVDSGTIIGSLPPGDRPYTAMDTVRRNFLTYSQAIEKTTPWQGTSMSALISASYPLAPDEESQVAKLTAASSDGIHTRYQLVSGLTSGILVFSVYAKAAEYSKLHLGESGQGKGGATFNLSNGTVISTFPAATSALIEEDISGYFRCSLVVSLSGGGLFGMAGFPDTGATVNAYGAYYAGNSSQGCYVWGAQADKVTKSDYQWIADGDEYYTVFNENSYLVNTNGGVGTLVISTRGNISVENLSGNAKVRLPDIQGGWVE